MKPISPKTLLCFSSSFSLSRPYRIFIAHFATYSLSSSKRQDDESRNVRVSVWWDFENCNVPAGVNVFKVAHTITAAIRANGIKGPVTITAFGDVLQLSRVNQEALSSTGINMAHVPNGGKNSADISLLVDLMHWVSCNPPPAHLFLISGDRDFARILHCLRMKNYNILLASKDAAPSVLCSAASIMWDWESLVRGENLAGKHFNQPPDGPYGSWYGHYKGSLVDPFSVAEPPPCSHTNEVPDSASDSRLRPVPKAVIRQIRNILSSHPKGVSITELRAELGRCPVSIDKDLYGYKKFSRFLLSMQHILELRREADGQFLVCGITTKAPEPFESSLGTSNRHVCKNGEQELSQSLKSNGYERFKDGAAKGKSVLPLSSEADVDEPSSKVQQLPISSEIAVDKDRLESSLKAQPLPPIDKKVIESVGVQEAESHQRRVLKQDSVSEGGFFKRIWQRWFSDKNSGSKTKSQDIATKCSDSGDFLEKKSQKTTDNCVTYGDSGKKKCEEKCMRSPSRVADPVEPVQKNKTPISAEACGDKYTSSPSVLSRIASWCKFGRSRPDPDMLFDQSSERLNQIDSNSQQNKVFLKDSFWSDMESFMSSPRVAAIVSQSRTRKHLAKYLQEEGPLALRELNESDLLDLVNLLIFEKKWVEEYPFETLPFKCTCLVGKSSSRGQFSSTNGLRSIFMGPPPEFDSPKILEDGQIKRSLSIPHSGVSGPVINKRHSDRSRNDILADCQKLVNEILMEYPDGYNLGSFRKLFLERYGYHLDVQKLGYQKLATLLQIMPGVRIESTYIFPSSKLPDSSVIETYFADSQETNADGSSLNSDSDSSETSKKNDDSDSQWEELGPVSNLNLDGEEVQSGLKSRAMKYAQKQTDLDYEPSVSDDESSDSEEETIPAREPEARAKAGTSEEASSLLQILDSWYSSKEGEGEGKGEGDHKKNKSENVDGMVECSTDGVKPSASSEVAAKSDTSLGRFGRKQRPQKNYSFVSEPHDGDKDKLIDGILGSLKKSGESRMQG